jgi:hypothetical protein
VRASAAANDASLAAERELFEQQVRAHNDDYLRQFYRLPPPSTDAKSPSSSPSSPATNAAAAGTLDHFVHAIARSKLELGDPDGASVKLSEVELGERVSGPPGDFGYESRRPSVHSRRDTDAMIVCVCVCVCVCVGRVIADECCARAAARRVL